MAYFETRFRYSPEKIGMWKILCEYLQKFVPPTSIILDFGAGYCYFINNIKAKEKHAVDVDKVVLDYANREVKAHVGKLENLKFKDGYFDVVFSSNLLEHLTVDEITRALKEVRKVLKENGLFIILVPNFRYSYRNYFDDYTHKTILTDRSLKYMLVGCGFEIEQIFPRFLPFSVESRLPINRLMLRIYLKLPWKPLAGQMLVIARKGKQR